MPRWYRFLEPSQRFVTVFLVALMAAAATAADAGVELRSTTTVHTADPPRVDHTVTLAADGNLRIDVSTGPAAGAEPGRQSGHTTIFRGAFNDFLVVDHGARTFTLIDDKAIEDLKAQLHYSMLMFDRRMAELPPDQRKRMRDALQAPQEAPTRFVDTGRKGEKGGLPCRLFEVRRGDELMREVWVAAWDQVAGGEQLKAALQGFEKFTDQLEQALKSVRSNALGGAEVFDLGGGNPFDDFERLGGLPVSTVEYENGEKSFETLIETTATRELSQRDFIPPSAYRQRSWSGE